MASADDLLHASHRRVGANEWKYAGDDDNRRHRAIAQQEMSVDSASTHHAAEVLFADSGHSHRPVLNRPRGSGYFPKPVHFVSSSSSAISSGEHEEHSRKDSPSLSNQARQAVALLVPGSLASNSVVVNMMRRMNYKEGSGLGKHGQGIVAPIEVAVRPKNAGLGTIKESSVGTHSPFPIAKDWPEWDEARGSKKQRHDWEIDLSEEKILASPLGEGAAEAIAQVHKSLTETARCSSGHQGQLCHGNEVAAITKAMARVQEAITSGTLTAGDRISELAALREKHPREYATFHLADTAREVVAPLLRALFRRWEPLEDPSRGLEAVTRLKGVLLDDGSAASPYAALVNDVVVGPVQASVVETWEARNAGPMFRLLEAWGDALPQPSIQCLLEQAVMPRLAAAVESWEPRWESVACHAWVLPWVPLLGRWLEPLYAAVRRKLGEALLGWHAARAAGDYEMVSPWKDAFGTAAWEEFVDRHVVPYLRRGLRALQIVPPWTKQDDDVGFSTVMRWAPVVAAPDMAWLLNEEFFSKWRDALGQWMRHAKPEQWEAVAWHEGWRRRLTPELLADECVRAHLEVGLDIINSAARAGNSSA